MNHHITPPHEEAAGGARRRRGPALAAVAALAAAAVLSAFAVTRSPARAPASPAALAGATDSARLVAGHAATVWWYGGVVGNGVYVDRSGTAPRAVVDLPSSRRAESVQVDLYVLPVKAGSPRTPSVAAAATARSGAVWDWADASAGGRPKLVDLAAGRSGSVTLSWPLVSRHGAAVAAGTYELIVPVVVDGRAVEYSEADFLIP